jgi:hypothetical protein
MKYILALLLIAGCSNEAEERTEVSDEIHKQNLLGSIQRRCEVWAGAVTDPEFVLSERKCAKETKHLEKQRNAWMAKVPKHLKAHVVYPGPQYSAHCHENTLLKTMDGGGYGRAKYVDAVQACVDFLKEWKVSDEL